MFSLDTSVSVLSGVGPARRTALEALGITTIQDLLYHVPFRYEDILQGVKISEFVVDTQVCFPATVVSKVPIKSRFVQMIKVVVRDESGKCSLTWFHTTYVLSALTVGKTYYFTGKVGLYKNAITLINPLFSPHQPLQGNLVPIYHESSEISSLFLRKLVASALAQTDLTESDTVQDRNLRHHLRDLKTALSTIHQPHDRQDLQSALHKLAFDEMTGLIEVVMRERQAQHKSRPTTILRATNQDVTEFLSLLPYPPTPSQKEAILAMTIDLTQTYPMNRLLQGEVGSGKTTVAAFALWLAAKHQQQSLLVCPTNVLAHQHKETLTRLFAKSGMRVGLYTGSVKESDGDILVGTHALLSARGIKPAVVVIDEEHRFGVKQRETFLTKSRKPHVLTMTATPIPRTIAHSILSDREVSFILPRKRESEVKTWLVPAVKRSSAYTWIAEQIRTSGCQAIIVCPFIEESTIETLTSVKSAKTEFAHLSTVFDGFSLHLLHGRLKEAEKQRIFAMFMNGQADILVTTPVIEVGVDLPKASIIVLEGAERYGLASLHQLRGRVGRRGQEAYCLLFPTQEDQETSTRLAFFSETYDGNALAEYDLRHRGTGEVLGTRQHGFGSLRFASWFDTKLIETCKHEVTLAKATRP